MRAKASAPIINNGSRGGRRLAAKTQKTCEKSEILGLKEGLKRTDHIPQKKILEKRRERHKMGVLRFRGEEDRKGGKLTASRSQENDEL